MMQAVELPGVVPICLNTDASGAGRSCIQLD